MRAADVRRVLEWYSARRYSVLFVSLLLTLILAPVTQEYHLQGWLLDSLYLVTLAAAAGGLDSSRRRIWAAVIVTVTAALRLLGRQMVWEPASQLATGLFVGLAVVAAVTSLRFALQGRHADRERVGAALSTYLLAGQVFGMCYWQIGQLRAGTFAAAGTPTAAGALDLPTCVYFSFVTLGDPGIRRYCALDADRTRSGGE